MTFNTLKDKLLQYELSLATKQELVAWFVQNVKTITYVPILRKHSIAGIIADEYKLLVEAEDDYTKEFLYLRYDVVSTLNILFAYVEDIQFTTSDITIENYDLIMKSGFFDFVYSRAKYDFDAFVKKCDRMTGINDLQMFNNLLDGFARVYSVENVENVRKEINKIDMRKLSLLESVAKLNDQNTAEVVSAMKKKSLEESKGKVEEPAEEKK